MAREQGVWPSPTTNATNRNAAGAHSPVLWRDTGCALEFIRKNPEDGTPQYWRAPAENRLADTVWSGIPIYASTTSYPTKKNEALLTQITELASSPGDIVLDAFAGSGTTCAVAEKLGRRWIGIDCGKLAIYTIQKRLLNLRKGIGNKGGALSPKLFGLYNAGLYDFSNAEGTALARLAFLRAAAFQCRDEPHRIGGIQMDGTSKVHSVHGVQPLRTARRGASTRKPSQSSRGARREGRQPESSLSRPARSSTSSRTT